MRPGAPLSPWTIFLRAKFECVGSGRYHKRRTNDDREKSFYCGWRPHAISQGAHGTRALLGFRSRGRLRQTTSHAPAAYGLAARRGDRGLRHPRRGRDQYCPAGGVASGLRQTRAGVHGATQLRLGFAGRGLGGGTNYAWARPSGAGRRNRSHEPRAGPVEHGDVWLAGKDAALPESARSPADAGRFPSLEPETGFLPAARSDRPAGEAIDGTERRSAGAPVWHLAREPGRLCVAESPAPGGSLRCREYAVRSGNAL